MLQHITQNYNAQTNKMEYNWRFWLRWIVCVCVCVCAICVQYDLHQTSSYAIYAMVNNTTAPQPHNAQLILFFRLPYANKFNCFYILNTRDKLSLYASMNKDIPFGFLLARRLLITFDSSAASSYVCIYIFLLLLFLRRWFEWWKRGKNKLIKFVRRSFEMYFGVKPIWKLC